MGPWPGNDTPSIGADLLVVFWGLLGWIPHRCGQVYGLLEPNNEGVVFLGCFSGDLMSAFSTASPEVAVGKVGTEYSIQYHVQCSIYIHSTL